MYPDIIINTVIYLNPTGAGQIIKKMYFDYQDAVTYINRQAYPNDYIIEEWQPEGHV